MDDAFGKLFSIVFGILLLLYLSIVPVTQRLDNTSQAYVQTAVAEFVDTTRSIGYISDTLYEELCRKVDTVIPMAQIDIEHKSQFAYVNDAGECEYDYIISPKNDILDVIYSESGENNKYRMKKGDMLQVVVYNRQPTLATKIIRMLMPGYLPNNVSIYTCYSGSVGNN